MEKLNHTQLEKLTAVGTGILMSCVLVVPGAYALLAVWLALWGLVYLKGFTTRVWRPSIELFGPWLWLGLSAYVLIGVTKGIANGVHWGYYEAYVPMLLAPLMLNAVISLRLPQMTLWMGAAMGAILAGLVATYQSLVLQVGRAGGALNNVIMFGDIAVVLAMFAAFGSLYGVDRHQPSKYRWILYLGAFMGLWASLLSGSKGGWLSILMLAVLWAWMALSHWHWRYRVLMSLLVLLLIVAVALIAPADLVFDRIVSGFNGAMNWFTTGQITDGSVSIRLEKWRQAMGMMADEPIWGWGTQGAIDELRQRMIDVGAGDAWIQTENDFLQAGIVHGLLGLLSYLAFYAALIASFLKAKSQVLHAPRLMGLATVGIFLVVLFLEFGLSVIVLGRSAFRFTLMTWSVVVLGLLLLHSSQIKKSFPSFYRNSP